VLQLGKAKPIWEGRKGGGRCKTRSNDLSELALDMSNGENSKDSSLKRCYGSGYEPSCASRLQRKRKKKNMRCYERFEPEIRMDRGERGRREYPSPVTHLDEGSNSILSDERVVRGRGIKSTKWAQGF